MIVAIAIIFAAVFMAVLALFLAVNAARQSPAAELKRRLRRMAENGKDVDAEALAADLLRDAASGDRLFFRLPLMGRLKRLVEHSGVPASPIQFVVLTATIAIFGFLGFFLAGQHIFLALFAAFSLAVIPCFYLNWRKQQRIKKFDEQLPDILTMIARSLRAGHSLTAAVELVGMEMAEPAGRLFKMAYEQQKLGMRMVDSLGLALDTIDSIDLHFFVTIIRINSESGGNLSEILEKLAATVTSRLQIRRQVQVYTAEGRLSGYVLVLLPVILFAAFYMMRPEYMSVFFTERMCQLSLCAAVLGQIVGLLIMRKIIDIRI